MIRTLPDGPVGWAGAPSRTRTCNPKLRRLVLYPLELWALKLVGASGFEPPTFGSQNRRAKPGCATPRQGRGV